MACSARCPLALHAGVGLGFIFDSVYYTNERDESAGMDISSLKVRARIRSPIVASGDDSLGSTVSYKEAEECYSHWHVDGRREDQRDGNDSRHHADETTTTTGTKKVDNGGLVLARSRSKTSLENHKEESPSVKVHHPFIFR